MAETVNIGEIANRLSNDIFKHFFWRVHPRRDENFKCLNPAHLTAGRGKRPAAQKDTHPADVVFSYEDPYLGKTIHLHTDLKSYGRDSISTTKLRSALESLSMTIDCARVSEEWRNRYSDGDGTPFEVRGLLFVSNHDQKYLADFQTAVEKTNLATLDLPANIYLHFLGPTDISRLFTICNDLVRLKYERTLHEDYTFYYPDLVTWRRHGDVWNQAATIETLTAPYFIIKYPGTPTSPSGYLIYYSRKGESAQEFEYFLDSLSRYQMLEPNEMIRIRMVHSNPHPDYKSNFRAATNRYARAWGFDQTRMNVLEGIKVEPVTAVATTYNSVNIGWRAE